MLHERVDEPPEDTSALTDLLLIVLGFVYLSLLQSNPEPVEMVLSRQQVVASAVAKRVEENVSHRLIVRRGEDDSTIFTLDDQNQSFEEMARRVRQTVSEPGEDDRVSWWVEFEADLSYREVTRVKELLETHNILFMERRRLVPTLENTEVQQ